MSMSNHSERLENNRDSQFAQENIYPKPDIWSPIIILITNVRVPYPQPPPLHQFPAPTYLTHSSHFQSLLNRTL